MKNLNLKGATLRDIENFFLEALSEDINTITCKTGEIGLLLFHRLVEDWMSKIGVVKKELKINTNVGVEEGQYTKYSLANGKNILLLHDPELDLREGQEIDDETGFPVKASTLHLKE